jgi:hypothetical protein
MILLLNKKKLYIKLVVKSLFYTMMHGRKSIKLQGYGAIIFECIYVKQYLEVWVGLNQLKVVLNGDLL